MEGRFLIGSNEKPVEGNIYSDKSAVVLDWLLREGIKSRELSVRNVSKESGISLGSVQRVFETLVLKGILQVEGIRTAKKFFLKDPKRLLESWLMRIGFPIVLESAFIKIGQHLVELIHIPSNPPPAHFQLHGHVHEKRPGKIISNQLNLCVEVWGYKPVSEKALLSLLDKTSKNANNSDIIQDESKD